MEFGNPAKGGKAGETATAPEKLTEEHVRSIKEKALTKLEVKNERLQDITILKAVKWEQLEYVDVSGNQLLNIDILNIYRNIRVLMASNNHIYATSLSLSRLEVLDLNYNDLDEIPRLNGIPRLEKLMLKQNEIRTLGKTLSSVSKTLVFLDLCENEINYIDEEEYQDWLKLLKSMIKLTELNIHGNPLEEINSNYEGDFGHWLPALQFINGKNASSIKGQQRFQFDAFGIKAAKMKGVAKKMHTISQKAVLAPKGSKMLKLKQFNEYLEEASAIPSCCLENLEALSSEIDKILENLSDFEAFMEKEYHNSFSEAHGQIENFLQSLRLLLENQPKLGVPILRILAKLCIIKFGSLGLKCFSTMEELMRANKDLHDHILSILDTVVLPKLYTEEVAELPISLVEGLTKLVISRKCPHILNSLIPLFEHWLKSITDEVLTHEESDKEAYALEHDKALGLIAASLLKSRENAYRFNDNMFQCITTLLHKTLPNYKQQRYLSLLNIIRYLAKHSKDAAENLTNNHNIHRIVGGAIRETLRYYKKSNDLQDEENTSGDDIKTKYEIFASQIETYASLLKSDTKFDDISRSMVTEELLHVTTNYKTDPKILTAVCILAYELISTNKIKGDTMLMEKYVKKMQRLTNLLHYLGGRKYQALCDMGEKYQAGTFIGREAIPIGSISNKVIHRLFIMIIKLITIFCEESVKKQCQSTPVMEDVSKALNDNQREYYLFLCLEVPNDKVKLAVVECLNKIHLSELETDEIGHLVRMLGSYKNLGAGKTELVLAHIFWILTKLANEKDEEPGKIFRSKYAELAIADGLDILRRNQSRYVDDLNEAEERRFLSVSAVHFLKSVSAVPDLRNFLTFNTMLEFKKILHAEEKFATHFLETPIEIELSWMGKNIEYLLQTTTGFECLSPYTSVALRIIQEIGDVLRDTKDPDLLNPFEEEKEYEAQKKSIIEHLLDDIKIRRTYRINRERKAWSDPPKHFLDQINAKSDKMKEHFLQQHLVFSTNKGIDRLLMFLTGRTGFGSGVQIERYLQTVYGDKYQSGDLEERITKFIGEKEKEWGTTRDSSTSTPGKSTSIYNSESTSTPNPSLNNPSLPNGGNIRRDTMKMALQQEPLGVYSEEKMLDSGIYEYEEDKIEEMGETNIHNNSFRSLIIAAALRCIQGAIEFAPTKESKKHAIEQLRVKQAFRWLTELCSITGWVEANVGAKYLRIVRQVLMSHPSSGFADIQDLKLFEILSIALSEMLEIMNKRLKREEKVGLTAEDKVFLSELVQTGSILCAQIGYFKLSNTSSPSSKQHSYQISPTPLSLGQEYLISHLIPFECMHVFVSILFHSNKISNAAVNPQIEKMLDEAFIGCENTREHCASLLGEYMTLCRGTKYRLIESLMQVIIFDRKFMNPSYLQDILNTATYKAYRMALEGYIQNSGWLFNNKTPERVNMFAWCEVAEEGSAKYYPKLLVMTNLGIYLFKRSSSAPCKICPSEMFCPQGPRLDVKYKYKSLSGYIDFAPDQQVGITLITDKSMFSAEKAKNFIFIFPYAQDKKRLIQILNELLDNLVVASDRLIADSINKICPKYQYVQYIKLGADKKWKVNRFFEDGHVIENCYLMSLTDQKLIFMKHSIGGWFYVEEQYDEELSDNEDDDMDYVGGPTEEVTEDLFANSELEKMKRGAIEKLMKVGYKEDLSNLKEINTSTSKDPAVQLIFQNSSYYVYFSGDIAKQAFLKKMKILLSQFDLN